MAWPGLGKCTAYLSPGQDSLPLGVRWFSDGLSGAGGRGWDERGATVDETRLEVEKRKRGSARPTACRPAAKRKMVLVSGARTEKVAAARLRAPVNAKITTVERHDWYLADA